MGFHFFFSPRFLSSKEPGYPTLPTYLLYLPCPALPLQEVPIPLSQPCLLSFFIMMINMQSDFQCWASTEYFPQKLGL